MRDLPTIEQEYAKICAKLGDLVFKQRSLHVAAEHCIRELEALEQEARGLAATSTPAAAEQPKEQ